MSCDWPRITIQSLLDNETIIKVKDGNYGSYYPRKSEFGEEGVLFLTAKLLDGSGNIDFENAPRLSKDKADSLPFGFLKEGDVLLSHNATIGRVAIVPKINEPVLIGTSLTHYRLNSNKLSPRYLAAFFSGKDFQDQLASVMSHTTRNQVPITAQKKLSVIVPPIQEQNAIASILECFDSKITLHKKQNQTLEQIAQAIFKSWFVDFEPVKAKINALTAGGSEEHALFAAMQAISGKGKAQLTQLQTDNPEHYNQLRTTAELFPAAMQDSELGEIPEGWEVNKVSSEIDVLNGFAFKSGDYVGDSGIFVLRTKNFNDSGIVERLSDDVLLPTKFMESHKKYVCEPYDYHLVMVGASIGKTAVIFPSDLPALRNQNMWCFRPSFDSKVSKVFTKYMLDELVIKLKGVASGSAREFFRKGDFQKYKVCLGTESIQKAFEQTTFPLIEQQAKNMEANRIISDLRDTLLPKLLAGEIKLNKIDSEQQG